MHGDETWSAWTWTNLGINTRFFAALIEWLYLQFVSVILFVAAVLCLFVSKSWACEHEEWFSQ